MDIADNKQLVKQGAEAKIFKGSFLRKPAMFKERFRKTYRHPILDESITKERMKAEARSLVRCRMLGIHTPAVYSIDFSTRVIIMEDVSEDTQTMRMYIDNVQNSNKNDVLKELKPLMERVGQIIATLHKNSIVHGDLTTSNMLVKLGRDRSTPEVIIIDFGLSYVDGSAEDKGVDLYVLERAFLSTHPNTEELFKTLLQSYRRNYGKGSSEVLNKLEEVRMRGRKRTMVG
ncbi:TP53-regulating kinase-like [Limulus polyphemus]|uniref:non-specific serine/threonine protein kinase n=1 Tax=Limulus polyphemus TaxID=6850 RepID=A0ABM1BLB5_LIMPO|nr:TP53-regulating kinase-like [Limulus polyphemus]